MVYHKEIFAFPSVHAYFYHFQDNDSLASRVAVEIGADLAILMSDVDGIYDKPPSHDNARVIHTFVPSDVGKVEFGAKSNVGTGGMESKVKSALWALDNGTSVVICNGMKYRSIRKIIDGEKVGTFFAKTTMGGQPAEILAKNGNFICIYNNLTLGD